MGINTGDDAAVYRINDELALVQTVDFFPPVVDDPYTYGAIAVANAVSDIYAMGGKPLTALNIVGFPIDQPKSVLAAILLGGAHKAQEANLLIVGGHTVDDAEPKYGLAVTGIVKPGEQLTNAGSKPGDVLVLTKPLGCGIITTALKQQRVEDDVLQAGIRQMLTLNRAASEAAIEVGVNACTDVTGFGLLGHLHGMMHASGVEAHLAYDDIPLISGAWELAVEKDIVPGGTGRNRSFIDPFVTWGTAVHAHAYKMLYDPQTSGGLLLSVPAEKAGRLVEALRRKGVETRAIIGVVRKGTAGAITIEP